MAREVLGMSRELHEQAEALASFVLGLVLRSSNTVHKSAPPVPRRFGRTTPHPCLRFLV
jgi:hypothetical protein